jgi:hypothetical protein
VQLFRRESNSEPQQRSAEQNDGHYDNRSCDHPGKSCSSRSHICVLATDFGAGAGGKRPLAQETFADCDRAGSGIGRDHATVGLLEYKEHQHYRGNSGGNLHNHGECHFRECQPDNGGNADCEVGVRRDRRYAESTRYLAGFRTAVLRSSLAMMR